jgi:hypothetical protein
VSRGPASRVRFLVVVGPFEAWGEEEQKKEGCCLGESGRTGGRCACANLREKKKYRPLIPDRRGENGWTRRCAICGVGDWSDYAAGC